VKAKKRMASDGHHKSTGMKMVEKYRPRMSRLTDSERQKLMMRGLRMIYGNIPAARSSHRG
jgi:hypothetical protein